MKFFPFIARSVLFFAAICGVIGTNAFADPQLTSWYTINSGEYARVYTTTNTRNSGVSTTTWTGQNLPSYADVAEVLSSANWVYIKYPDLASYTMGPWLTPQGTQFMFWPTNQHGIAKFPRHPSVPPGNKTITGTGYSGNYVNGMAIFNALDGKAYDGSNLVMGPHNKADYYWHRNAPVGEGFNFDYALGHQNPAGVYHTHQNPIALRYQLGDHVDYNPSTKKYSESTNSTLQHSPIIGWAYDGYPIYGPYGYSVTNDSGSAVRRMIPGYVVRDGSNGTDDLSANLTTIPAWYARFRQTHFGGAYSTTASTARPSVDSNNYPLGTFAEDFSYLGDLTNANTGQLYRQAVDFDLDQYNGRWCVTPEFPGGTYAYFVAIDANGNATYPYVFGYEFYGNATGDNGVSITESVTTNFIGGADMPLTLSAPTVNSADGTVSLVWSSVDGGTYQVENSANQSDWTLESTNISSQGISTTNNFINLAGGGTNYARVTRTALASYDDAGSGSGVVSQSATQPYGLPAASSAISINFQGTAPSSMTSSETAGVLVVSNWNNATLASNSFNNLVDSGGNATSASATWNADGIGATAASNDPGDSKMMKGYLDVTNGSTGTVVVTNLPFSISSNSYNVLVYFDSASGSAHWVMQFTLGSASYFGRDNTFFAGTYSASTATSDSGISTPTANYVLFTNVSGNSFTLTATPGFASDGNPHAAINGIQIFAPGAVGLNVTTNPASQTVCAGEMVSFTAAADSAFTFTTQWQLSLAGGPFIDLPGETNWTLTMNAGLLNSGNRYRAVFSNSFGNSATTDSETLTVDAIPNAAISVDSTNVLANSSGHTATAAAEGSAYAWTISNGTITGATNLQTVTYTAGAAGEVTLGLTVANDAGCSASNSVAISIVPISDGVVSSTNFDSIISLATNVTKNYTFTDPSNGLSVVVAVTLTPYSSTNANAVFSLLDYSDDSPRRMAVDSGLFGGDGNWVERHEGFDFTASLVSASPRIDPGSIRFGIIGVGIRSTDANFSWNSSANTNEFFVSTEAVYALDTNTMALAESDYAGEAKLASDIYQLSDMSPFTGKSLVLKVTFSEANGSAPVMAIQPVNTSACVGDMASFVATANGDPAPTVQWQVKTNGGSSFVDIANATNTTLNFVAALANNGSEFQAVFSNSVSSVTSTSATLTVNAAPVAAIDLSPESVDANSTGNTASALAGEASYAWTISNGVISSATNLQTITYTAGASGSVQLNLVVENGAGCSASASTEVAIHSVTVTNSPEGDPQLTSWITASPGKYARIYLSDAARTNGISVTTWTNTTQHNLAQTLPAYASVQEVDYSANWIYVRSSDFANYIMGPWYNDATRTTDFINSPTNQHVLYVLPRTATLQNPPAVKSPTYGPIDAIGYFVNGVAMFDALDGNMWNGTTEVMGGNYQWRRAAYPNENVTFDPSYSHQQNTGQYHNHADPIGLRYTLGDHVDFNPVSKIYSESTNAPTKHSPILGWVRDGYPIYGPYGYSNPTNAASGIRRMISGYQLRNGQNGSDNLAVTGRATLPAWMLRNNGNVAQTGPSVSSSYPLGRYLQDYAYLGDLTNSATGAKYQLGVDFDLNEYDCRWCVTPEFPNGTYAYFVTIDSNGIPVAPWNIGMYFFGNPTGYKGTNITEAVATNFVGVPNVEPVLNSPTLNGGNVTLTWSATEGGRYRVESTTNFSSWTTNTTNVSAVLDSASYTVNASDANRFYRVAQTGLANYDPVILTNDNGGGGSGTSSVAPGGSAARGSTVTVTITLPGNPPNPPANAPITSITLAGTISGTNISDATQGTVIATFTIPADAPTGAQNIVVTFSVGPTYTLTGGFTIN
jgi:hypothetical protein